MRNYSERKRRTFVSGKVAEEEGHALIIHLFEKSQSNNPCNQHRKPNNYFSLTKSVVYIYIILFPESEIVFKNYFLPLNSTYDKMAQYNKLNLDQFIHEQSTL